MTYPVILDAVRTPFARVGGAYREIRSDQLLAHTLQGVLARSGVDGAEIGDVVTGCVTQSGEQGGNISRIAVLMAGLPASTPASTINRWCGSGQQAVHSVAQAIAAGDINCGIAAGVESMTRAPIYSDVGGIEQMHPEACQRFRLVHQGESGERIAQQWHVTREQADRFGMESMRRASQAALQQWNREIIATEGKSVDGHAYVLTRDEGIRDTVDPAKVASLKPVFRSDGVLTAANSSQFADGASAVLLANSEWARAEGLQPRAHFRARVVAADDPAIALMAVVPATRQALDRAGVSIDDLDWIEFNEAFATVVLAWAQEVGADLEKVNPWGGAIAHGHAVGATGGALLAKMLTGLEAVDGTLGLQVMTIGHGQATASVIERI